MEEGVNDIEVDFRLSQRADLFILSRRLTIIAQDTWNTLIIKFTLDMEWEVII